MILRDYQKTLFDEIHGCIKSGIRNPLVCSPTGSGKTATFCYIAHRSSSAGNRVLILVHRRELVTQTSATLKRFDVGHGIIMPGVTPNPMALVQIGMVQTINRRIDKIKEPQLIIVDECHHAVSNTYASIMRAFPKSVQIGFSATPARLDGKGLGDYFGKIIMGPSVEWLMQNGHLVRPRYFSLPMRANLEGVKKRMGDYASDQLAERMDTRAVLGDAVEHYARICNGSRAVVFCVNLKHAENTRQQFQNSGIPAGIIHGGQTNAERKQVIDELTEGRIKILTSVSVIEEGFDLPSAEAAILLRPTTSLGLHLQQIGRVLRPATDKKAVILDHVGNLLTHGLAEDTREWSLDGIEKKKKGQNNEPATHVQCKKCYAMHPRELTTCPECGHVDEKRIRELKQIEGELIEIEAIKAAPLELALHDVRSAADIDKIRAAKGYKPGWAWHMKKKMGYLR